MIRNLTGSYRYTSPIFGYEGENGSDYDATKLNYMAEPFRPVPEKY